MASNAGTPRSGGSFTDREQMEPALMRHQAVRAAAVSHY